MSSPSQSLSTTLLNQFAEQPTARERGAEFTRVQLFVLLLAPAVVAVLPILIWGVPNGPDLASHLRFAQAFNESLSQGNIYPAWQHLANGGYGDGSFRIYSPFIYYALSAIKFFAGDWMLTFKLLIVAMAAAGSFCSFYWLRGFASVTQAAVGAAIYSFAPFRINELYSSSMLSQYAGAAFFVVLLGVVERLADQELSRRRLVRLLALFGLSSGALIITHIPLAMMAVLTVPLYAALRFDRGIRIRRFIHLAAAGAIGFALSAFYWLNLVRELPLLNGATIKPGFRFNYRANFALSTASHDNNALYVNLLFLATALLMVPVLFSISRSFQSSNDKRAIRTILVAALFTLAMTTPISIVLWKILPKLSSMEFPWRWLSPASMLVSGLAGASLPLLVNQLKHASEINRARLRRHALLATGAVVIAIVFSWTYPIRNALFTGSDAFAAKLQDARNSPGLEEWLPRWATLDGAIHLAAQSTPQISVAGRSVSIQRWDPERREFTIGDGTAAAAQIRTFYYPYWELRTREGRALPTRPNANGVLIADVPAGVQAVNMTFVRPSHQTIGNLLTIAGVATLLLMTILTLRKRQSAILT